MRLRPTTLLPLALVLASSFACSPNQNPDEIRERTAHETATLKRDSKAVAQGIKDGLTEKKSVDLNRSSADELAGLPGMDSHKAERIVAERPYANARQLVTRHVLTEDEYGRIQDRITVAR